MAEIVKKHEQVVAPFFKNGVTLQFFTITFPGSVAGLNDATAAGVKSPVVQALEAVAQLASVELIGTISTTTLPIAVAALGGAFGTADYDSDGDTETFAAALQAAIAAAGTTTGALQGVDNASTTVAAGVRGQTF